jgi:hypothetical protein
MGAKSLVHALAGASSATTAGFGMPGICAEMAPPKRFELSDCIVFAKRWSPFRVKSCLTAPKRDF